MAKDMQQILCLHMGQNDTPNVETSLGQFRLDLGNHIPLIVTSPTPAAIAIAEALGLKFHTSYESSILLSRGLNYIANNKDRIFESLRHPQKHGFEFVIFISEPFTRARRLATHEA
jgi:hypothetical protein